MGEKAHDIYEVLKADHRQVTAMLEELSAIPASNPAERERLFLKIREELIRHAEAEEHVFYSLIRQHPETREIALEGAQEHHQVRTLLREMTETNYDSEVWTAKLQVLCENLEHHIHEEEDEMFPKARRVLRGRSAEDAAAQFKAEKKQIEP